MYPRSHGFEPAFTRHVSAARFSVMDESGGATKRRASRLHRLPHAACLVIAALLASPGVLSAATITMLHSFNGTNGETPIGRLVEGGDGNFYGVTKSGGTDDCGTIFRITPTGDHAVLHSFIGAQDGCEPESGLTRGPEAEETYYGVARFGGSGNVGTAYRITPDGDFETIHHFSFPGTTPRGPYGRLLLGGDGHFYGTSSGPLHGTLFRLSTNGDVLLIHTFEGGAGGAFPQTGLTADQDGNLYGATVFGGPGGPTTSSGVIFKLSPVGDDFVFTVLHNIVGGSSHPFDGPLVLGPDGNHLYGTTAQGGTGAAGIAYRISTDGEVFTVFEFPGFDGTWPVSTPGGGLVLAADGHFYGSAGTFYRMTASGEITRLTDGMLPGGVTAGAVVQGSAGDFYGVSRGGPGLGAGWVFRVSGVGDGGGGPPPDTTPDAFSFDPVAGTGLNTLVTSNPATITGIDAPSPVTVTGGEYSIGGMDSFTSSPGSIQNDQTIRVRHQSAMTYVTQTTTTLTIGGVSADFVSTTLDDPGPGPITTPDPFGFAPQNDVLLSTEVTSNAATITGIEAAADVTVSNGSYSVGCTDAFTTSPGTIENEETVCVRHVSAVTCLTSVTTTLTVGGVQGSFTSTTIDDSVDSDGDGVSDCLDEYPFDGTIATPTLPGGNVLTVETESGSLADVHVFAAGDAANQTGRPEGQNFPYGLTGYEITGLNSGDTVTVTLTYPAALPSDATIYKYDDATGFVIFDNAAIIGATVTLTLTDGGDGDADGVADGVIVDPVGVALAVSGSSGGGGGGGAIGWFALLMMAGMLILRGRRSPVEAICFLTAVGTTARADGRTVWRE